MTEQPTPPIAEQRRKRRKSLLQELLETLLLTLILFGVAKFSVQTFQVQGTSMVPTLQDNEYILVDRVSYRFHTPPRGDIIVFRSPPSAGQSGKDFIKRVIGEPGDVITLKRVNGVTRVFVNNRMLDEPYISGPPLDSSLVFPGENCYDDRRTGCSYKVPKGDLFVMGDNRPGSYDSRQWGPLPMGNVIGRALVSYWPLSHLAFLPNQYSYASTGTPTHK